MTHQFLFLLFCLLFTTLGILSASNIPKLSTHSIAECFPVDNSTEFQNQLEDLIDPRASVCNDFERLSCIKVILSKRELVGHVVVKMDSEKKIKRFIVTGADWVKIPCSKVVGRCDEYGDEVLIMFENTQIQLCRIEIYEGSKSLYDSKDNASEDLDWVANLVCMIIIFVATKTILQRVFDQGNLKTMDPEVKHEFELIAEHELGKDSINEVKLPTTTIVADHNQDDKLYRKSVLKSKLVAEVQNVLGRRRVANTKKYRNRVEHPL